MFVWSEILSILCENKKVAYFDSVSSIVWSQNLIWKGEIVTNSVRGGARFAGTCFSIRNASLWYGLCNSDIAIMQTKYDTEHNQYGIYT